MQVRAEDAAGGACVADQVAGVDESPRLLMTSAPNCGYTLQNGCIRQKGRIYLSREEREEREEV